MAHDEFDEVTRRHQFIPARLPGKENRARIVALAGSIAGERFQIDSELIFGRSSDVGVQVDDALVSRRHACIRMLANGAYVIEDLGSRNGTRVNGEKLTTQQVLSYGDRIQVGSCVFLFTHHDSVEAEIEHRRKLEAIGRLGTGVAHDFNNLLASVSASIDFLRGLNPETRLDNKEVKDALTDIRASASAATEMTSRLLGFAKEVQRNHGPVELAKLCENVVALARHTFHRGIKINTYFEEGLEISGDEGQLHQFFMNLLINARDAMPNGGVLTLRAERASSDHLGTTPLNPLQEHAIITVEDTGVGMDAKTRERAFDPFFTTKSGEVGAGLGLAAVYEIARAHNGHVTVHSEPGKGTKFQIVFPIRTGRSVLPPKIPGAIAHAPKTRLLILLVDDEDMVRRSAGRVVRQSGHRVIFAKSGEEAVQIYSETQPRPDLVLMDLNMPGMTGDETFKEIRKFDPQAPVVFVSGYWDNDLEAELRADGALGFVQKPYEAATLRNAIVQAMTAQAS